MLELTAALHTSNSHLEPKNVLNGGHHHHHESTQSNHHVEAANNSAALATLIQPYDRKEISHLVRKTWRSAHVECSAKYNWNVVHVFRELAITLDMVANGQVLGSANHATRKKRCLVFWKYNCFHSVLENHLLLNTIIILTFLPRSTTRVVRIIGRTAILTGRTRIIFTS